MRDYTKHADDVFESGPNSKEPGHNTGGKPIVGNQGWGEEDLTPAGRRIPGREPTRRRRELQNPGVIHGVTEYWQLSQTGLQIMEGFKKTQQRDKNKVVWVEDPSQFKSEKDIFDFIHVDYLQPHERCA